MATKTEKKLCPCNREDLREAWADPKVRQLADQKGALSEPKVSGNGNVTMGYSRQITVDVNGVAVPCTETRWITANHSKNNPS